MTLHDGYDKIGSVDPICRPSPSWLPDARLATIPIVCAHQTFQKRPGHSVMSEVVEMDTVAGVGGRRARRHVVRLETA